METYIDLENMLLRHDNTTVRVIIQDYVHTPWFNAKHVCMTLGYDNYKTALKLNVSSENKKQLKHLVSNYKSLYKKVKGKTYFLNNTGLNELIIKSNNAKAKEIQKWIANDVMPIFRKEYIGKYDLSLKQKIGDMDTKYKLLYEDVKEKNKDIMQFENGPKTKQFLKHPAVYIIRPSVVSNKNMNKIGSCKDASKRFSQYNTSVPDNIHVIDVFYVENYKQVEQALNAMLFRRIHKTERTGKKYYKCSRNQIWDILDVSILQLEGKHLSEIKKELRGSNRHTIDDDKAELYEFESDNQSGGSVVTLSDSDAKLKLLKYITKISALIEKMGGLDDIVL